MASEIRIPRLGWNMEEGVFLGWLKREGDSVRPGEPLFRLEGDKAVQEVEATDAGILRIAPGCPREGDTVAVGTLLGHLTSATEVIPAPVKESTATPVPVPVPAPVGSAVTRSSSGRRGISPRARRLAREVGLDWSTIPGSGRGGRIREADVRAAMTTTPPVSEGHRQTLSPIRRAIATKMRASLSEMAPVTLTTTADASNLVNLRQQFQSIARASEGTVPSYTDFIIKLTAVALKQHPALNARWEQNAIVELPQIHIALAVDTEAGLLAPVIRDVPGLTLRQLAARSRELIEKARARRLSAEETSGSTFTVTNLGAFGVDAFTPIINHPECAILGVGRIQPRPVVVAGQIEAREQVTLSLTFDHRVIDGAPAARFLDTLRQCLENPGPWLMG